jgi:hypothetical protein
VGYFYPPIEIGGFKMIDAVLKPALKDVGNGHINA